jgi:hypothetical protein
MASRNTILKLKQDNTGKVLSININQEIVEKPNVPSGLGLHWKHPFSGQWIQNARRIKDTRRIVDIAKYYHTQSTLIIDTYDKPNAECNWFDIKYTGFGTDVNDSGELVRDPKIIFSQDDIDQYFKNLISIKSPHTQIRSNQVILNFKHTVGQDPVSMASPERDITIFYISIADNCGYTNIIPLDFSKIK